MNGVNKVSVVLGAQWGDEGKGKIVDLLCTEKDVICRCQVFILCCLFCHHTTSTASSYQLSQVVCSHFVLVKCNDI